MAVLDSTFGFKRRIRFQSTFAGFPSPFGCYPAGGNRFRFYGSNCNASASCKSGCILKRKRICASESRLDSPFRKGKAHTTTCQMISSYAGSVARPFARQDRRPYTASTPAFPVVGVAGIPFVTGKTTTVNCRSWMIGRPENFLTGSSEKGPAYWRVLRK
jgi:hypothetical protein